MTDQTSQYSSTKDRISEQLHPKLFSGVGGGLVTTVSVEQNPKTTVQSEQQINNNQSPNNPLKKLDAPDKKYSVTTLRYPYDLATDPTKTHWVQFSIRQITPGRYNAGDNKVNILSSPNSVAAVKELAKNGMDALAESSTVQRVAASNAGQAVLNSNIVNQAKQEFAVVGAFAETAARTGLTVTPPTNQSTAIITLYMPDTLTAQYNSDYTKIDLRTEMGSTLRKIQSIESIAKTALETPGKGLKEILGNEIQSPAVLERIFNTSKRVGATQGFSDVLLQGQGYTVNPQMQMLYQGLGFRTFSLSFIFTPTSKSETLMVNDIIYEFKRAAAPRLNDTTASGTRNMFLVPPDIFNINFCWRGIENPYLPKYGDCVLENIDVNYAPNGWAAHDSDGSPLQTTLSLTFKEIEIVTRDRLDSGRARTFNGLR